MIWLRLLPSERQRTASRPGRGNEDLPPENLLISGEVTLAQIQRVNMRLLLHLPFENGSRRDGQ
jgi:hypothetical protein